MSQSCKLAYTWAKASSSIKCVSQPRYTSPSYKSSKRLSLHIQPNLPAARFPSIRNRTHAGRLGEITHEQSLTAGEAHLELALSAQLALSFNLRLSSHRLMYGTFDQAVSVFNLQKPPDPDASKSCILYETTLFLAKNTECSIFCLRAVCMHTHKDSVLDKTRDWWHKSVNLHAITYPHVIINAKNMITK